jgi:hydrogenase-4 component F
MVSGPVPASQQQLIVSHIPMILHMAIVLIIGLYMPNFLAEWFHKAVELLR